MQLLHIVRGTSCFEKLFLFRGKGVIAYNFIDLDQIFALDKRFEWSIVNEDSL